MLFSYLTKFSLLIVVHVPLAGETKGRRKDLIKSGIIKCKYNRIYAYYKIKKRSRHGLQTKCKKKNLTVTSIA